MHLLELFGRSRAKAPSRKPVTPVRVVIRPATAPPPVIEVAPPKPPDLRRLIFAAVASNDSEQLATMLRDNPDGVVNRAADWMKIPDELQGNPAAVRWYREGLQAVAQYCAIRLNRPDFVQRLEELGQGTAGL